MSKGGEMAQQLMTVLPEDQAQFPATNGSSQLFVTPVSGVLTPSHRHTCRQKTNEHKIRINKLFFNEENVGTEHVVLETWKSRFFF